MRPRALLALAVAVPGLACHAVPDAHPASPDPARAPVVLEDGRPAMGTVLEVTIAAPDAATATRWLEGTFARVERIEAQLSSWRPDSAISRLNRGAGSGAQAIPPEAAALLADARAFHARTTTFDVTVGPLVECWRRAAARGRLPSPDELAHAVGRVGASRIRLYERATETWADVPEGMRIDLGGLLKGWALDRVAEWLRAEGAERVLLNFGGSSLLAIGHAPDAGPWRVLVGRGAPGAETGPGAGVLAFADSTVSVSASLGQTAEIAGESFGHVVDPRTGWPVNEARLVVARGPRAAQTEAWSTALLVSGAQALSDAEAAGVSVLIVDADGTQKRSETFDGWTWLDAPEAP